MNKNALKWHLVEGPTFDFTLHLRVRDHMHDMILEVCWDGHWTLSFGLSQFHSYGSWVMCEVAFSLVCEMALMCLYFLTMQLLFS